MPKYAVQWRYSSGSFGPWAEGEVIDLSDEDAEIVNRDSPGVLVPEMEETKGKKLDSADRQVKKAQTRGR